MLNINESVLGKRENKEMRGKEEREGGINAAYEWS